LREQGIAVEIVSSSGTGTFDTGGVFPGVTEIQVGSYATMDGRYLQVGVPFEPALSALVSVISTPQPSLAIIDAGMKSISTDFGLPQTIDLGDSEVKYLSEEHGWIFLERGLQLQLADKIQVRPMHGCTTINLHDRYVVLRDGLVEAEWPVAARGRSQ
jgi:D-serine deaminase-like pyridoxal phosphate-dependent protein